MSSKTLEQYLIAAIDERDQIDHALRATFGSGGKVTFYVHPLNADGDTLDFVVRGNALALNLTSDSDVRDAVGVLMSTRIPILDQISELCWAIEKCGASPELTDAVTKASALRGPISELVKQALALGIDCGGMAAAESGEDEATGVAGCAGRAPTPIDDAIALGHCAANAADSLARLLGNMGTADATAQALGDLVQNLSRRAIAELGQIDVAGPVQITTIGDIVLHTTGAVDVKRHES